MGDLGVRVFAGSAGFTSGDAAAVQGKSVGRAALR